MKSAAEWAAIGAGWSHEWAKNPSDENNVTAFIKAIQRDAAEAQREAIYDYIRIDWPGCLTCASLIQSAPLVTLPKGET